MFEMMAPVFDIAMFAPDELHRWDDVTKMLHDCKIKTTTYTSGTPKENYYSTEDIKVVMKDPNYKDIHNHVLKFLEES